MANGYLHSAFESLPGNEVNTPTLSSKVLYTPLNQVQAQLNPSHLMRDDELRNVDEPIAVLPEAYDPSWSLNTRAYPDLTAFELKGILGAPTTTVGDGIITDPDGNVIPTGCYRHVFTAPFGPSGASPMTTQRQLSYADQTFYLKAKGCATSALSLGSPESGGVQLQASGPALYLKRQTSPGLTPSYESLTVPPFERANLVIETWLGSTAETADFTVDIANPAEMVRTLGVASRFPDVMEKGDPPIVISGSIPKRLINTTDWDALLNATGFAVLARWQSTAIIANSYAYAMWVKCLNAQYISGDPEPLANRRRHGATFDWKSTYAGSAGSTVITVVNATTSYA